MRRTTLGPLSTNTDRWSSAKPPLGGRRPSSMAPPLSAANGRRQSSMAPRHSLAPGRRPTSASHPGRRTDTRPLKDRAYMQTCIRDIVAYVLDHGYSYPISPKILTSPSSRDFQQLFLFLVRHFDPAYDFQGRFEDDIPALLKSYGYPVTISKSALSAVGSPHTWPMLLGALSWLLELIKYDESRAEKETALRESGKDGDIEGAALGQATTLREHSPLFINNIEAAYVQFLQGADDFPDLDQELAQKIEANSADVRERLSVLERRIPERTELLSTMKSRPLPSKGFQALRQEQEERYIKFETIIHSTTEYNASGQRKVAEKSAEVDKLQHSVNELSRKLDRLKQIVAEQRANSIDVNQITRDRTNLKASVRTLMDERTVAESAAQTVTEDLSRDTEAVASGLRSYRKGAETLMFIPETAANAKGVDYTLSPVLETHDSGQETVLSEHISSTVQPALRSLKDEHYKRHASLRGEELSNQERVDAMEEQLLLQRDEQTKLEGKLAKFDREYQSEKAAMAQQLAAHSEEVAKREEEMQDRRRRAQEKLRESNRVVESLAAQLRTFEENFATERVRVGRALTRSVERIRSHSVTIAEETSRVARHFAEEKARAQEENLTVGGGNA